MDFNEHYNMDYDEYDEEGFFREEADRLVISYNEKTQQLKELSIATGENREYYRIKQGKTMLDDCLSSSDALEYGSCLEQLVRDCDRAIQTIKMMMYSKSRRRPVLKKHIFTCSARPRSRARSVRRASRPTFSKSGGGGSGGDGESDQGDPPRHNTSVIPYSLLTQQNRFDYPWLVLGSCCMERGRAA